MAHSTILSNGSHCAVCQLRKRSGACVFTTCTSANLPQKVTLSKSGPFFAVFIFFLSPFSTHVLSQANNTFTFVPGKVLFFYATSFLLRIVHASHITIPLSIVRYKFPFLSASFTFLLLISALTSFYTWFVGIYLHNERSSDHMRADGTVPKPTMLERYLHRPLDSIFDSMDVVSYFSQFNMSKSPPQYAGTNIWHESPWNDAQNALTVFRRKPYAKVSHFKHTSPLVFLCHLSAFIANRSSHALCIIHICIFSLCFLACL